MSEKPGTKIVSFDATLVGEVTAEEMRALRALLLRAQKAAGSELSIRPEGPREPTVDDRRNVEQEARVLPGLIEASDRDRDEMFAAYEQAMSEGTSLTLKQIEERVAQQYDRYGEWEAMPVDLPKAVAGCLDGLADWVEETLDAEQTTETTAPFRLLFRAFLKPARALAKLAKGG